MINVIGAGLAGVEAAWYLANRGYQINLIEMRPKHNTEAHTTSLFSELVCSNSLRSNSKENAVGILKEEMRMLGSIVMESAELNKVPAGSSLAVDRMGFSSYITEKIKSHPNITIINEEITKINLEDYNIIATGPLTSSKLCEEIKILFGVDDFYFYDAEAPILKRDSIDFNIAYKKSRYDKGDADYINLPMTEEEFNVFLDALIHAESAETHDFDLKVFEACMPIEVMAKRGPNTLLFGPLKPVGLRKPDGTKPYAVVQLRQDDAKDTLYNMVGFQTHLKYGEQKRVFQLIPGLQNAEFIKYGVMHKNTYINSPTILKPNFQTNKYQNIFFAGQITGVEGYVESAASGLMAAIGLSQYLEKKIDFVFHKDTIMGSLAYYITHASKDYFEPMHANFGILSELNFDHNKHERKSLYGIRALNMMKKEVERIDG